MNKSKTGKKLLSLLLSVLMCLSFVPTVAFATEAETGSDTFVAKIGDTKYDTLAAAIAAAQDGDTILLGEGDFSTYGKVSTTKSLTFVGQGKETVWTVGDLSKNVGGEGNGDYTFDGCDKITFENMTLKSDGADYRGFIRINNTVVENCVLEGKTAYWGYNKAEFIGCTFNAPEGDYALWDYSSKEMSFDGCTFNISGKAVNVYVEAGNAGTAARKVELKDCTVNSSKANKAVLNIKNSTQAYDVVISGTNTVNGLNTDATTNSNLYQVETTDISESGGTVKVQEKKIVDGKEILTTVFEVKKPTAETAVAAIGDTKYETLQAAFDAAKTGDTVTLLSDITLTEQVNITKALNGLTLDGNGKTITCATTDDPFKSGGSALYFGNADSKLYCTGIKIKDLNMVGTARFAIFLCGGTTTEFTNVNISGNYYIAVNLYGTHGATMNNCNISNSTVGTDKYISGVWSNVASVNPLILNNTTVNVIAINTYTTANTLAPKILINEGSTAVIHTFDDGSVSGDKFLCVNKESKGEYSVKEFVKATSEWVDATVAEVGGVKYATLAAAIAAAKDGDTVTLLSNCSGNGIQVPADKYPAGLTIDFAGYSYTIGGVLVGSTGTASNGFQLLKGNKITMKNGSIYGDKSVAGDDKTEWSGAPAMMIQNYSDLTLDGMTVSGGKDTVYTLSNNNGSIVFKDSTINAGKGTMYGGPYAFDVCRFSSYPSVSVTVTGNSVINGNVEISGAVGAGQSRQLNIEGGTFTGSFKISGNVPANIAISGGTFANAIKDEWCADGFIPTENSDGTYGVKSGSYVAEVGGVKYETLQEAIDAAKTDDTVRLLADTTEDINISQNITLDLGGKTLTGTGAASTATLTVVKGAVVTVKNGNVVGTANSYYNIQNNGTAIFEDITATAGNTGSSMIDNWGTLTINSGNYTGGLNVVKSEEDSTLIFNGGKFVSDYAPKYGITGTVLVYGDTTINGGVFIQNGNSTNARVIVTGIVPGHAVKTVITGGSFTNNSNKNILHRLTPVSYEEFVVSGGTFNKQIPDGYCADGFIQVKNSDGTYGVKEGKYVAKIGSVKYESLEAAYAAAKNNATITLLADCESERINLEDKSVTVVLNGYTLTSVSAYGVMFCAKNGNTITVDGTAAGSKLVGTVMITSGTYGHIVLKGGTYENSKYCPIYVNGAVSNDESTVTVSDATVTLLPGASDQDEGTAVYLAGYSTATFTNSKITAPITGIEIRAGKLELTNCNVTGGNGAIETNANGSGATVKNAALAISQHNTKKAIEVTVKGGTFTGTAAVYQTDVQATGSNGVKVNIADGKFNGIVKAETANVMSISGGTFDNAVDSAYCADGYVPTKNADGTYGVTKDIAQYEVSLTLKDSIDVNMYVKLPVGTAQDIVDKYSVKVKFNGVETEYKLIKTSSDSTYDYYKIVIASAFSYEMTKPIDVTVYYDGAIVKYVEGYSIQKYLLSAYEDDSEAVIYKNLYKAALDYGANAQLYFDGKYYSGKKYDTNIDNLANATVNPKNEIAAIPENYVKTTKVEGDVAGIDRDQTLASVILGSEVSIKYYLKTTKKMTIDEFKAAYTFACDKEIKVADEGDGYFSITVGHIKSYELSKAYTLKVINGDETLLLTSSVLDYAYDMRNEADGLGKLCDALFAYSQAADAIWN